MEQETVFSLKLEPKLHAAFMDEAARDARPAAGIVRDWIRRYVEERQKAHEYEAFLRRKVDKARVSGRAGLGRSHEAVEADFAARYGLKPKSA
jgi:hypothetical protein